MRKMATIRKINAINPIIGADSIECAVIGGWTVVTRKGEYSVGDLAVFCEIDSFLPTALAPFLTKSGHFPKTFEGIDGERLRTVRLRKQLSQGLLLPFTAKMAIDIGAGPGATFADYEGTDVSELLGILKWEAPISAQLAGQVKGAFPIFIPKTDQERIQNLTTELAEWTAQDLTWERTEKLDGSSMTVYLNDGVFGVCSRNWDLIETEGNSFWNAARKLNLEEKLAFKIGNYALQGELIGEGIQGNRYDIKGHDFCIFDVYNIDTKRYLTPIERRVFIILLGLTHVPVIDDAFKLTQSVSDMLVAADGKSVLNSHAIREGDVFKCNQIEQSFKVISNLFLLKE